MSRDIHKLILNMIFLVTNSLFDNGDKFRIILQIVVGLFIFIEHEIADANVVFQFFFRIYSVLEDRLQVEK